MNNKEEKCIVCGKPASIYIHKDPYCKECGKQMRLKMLEFAFESPVFP